MREFVISLFIEILNLVCMKSPNLFLISLLSLFFSITASAQSYYWGYEKCGQRINEVFMVNAQQGYAIGEQGQVRVTNNGGSSWTFTTIPWSGAAPINYFGLWGTDASNVWITGERGTIKKWNGAGWVSQSFNSAPFNTVIINAIHGSSNTDAWAVSDKNYSFHYDGTNWNYVSTGLNFVTSLRAVWMAAGNNGWAVGDQGNIIHWDGSAWASQASGTTQTIYDVWGTDANHVWAGTTTGSILFYNGVSWVTQLAASGVDDYMQSIWGNNNTDMWAVGYKTGGGSPGSHIYHFDGSSWVLQTTILNHFLCKGQSIDAQNMWVVGGGGSIYKGNGSTWIPQKDETTNSGFRCAWSADYNNSWMAGGSGGISKWNGTVWQQQVAEVAGANALYGMYGVNTSNVWTVGENGVILKYDGTNWNPQVSGTGGYPLYSVWAADVNNVWAVGANGIILKYNGTSWSPQTSGVTNILLGVWGLDANNIWAVGAAGIILKYNGTSWVQQPSGLSTLIDLNAVWGTSATNVLACGTGGKFLKYDGANWSTIFNNSTQPLNAIWGRDASHIYLTGNGSAIFLWNGASLSNDYSPQVISSFSIIPRDANFLFAAGTNSIITNKTNMNLGVLPVIWNYFTAEEASSEVVLKWGTSFETNNKGFYVQKSTDGVVFSSLGFVPAKNLPAGSYTFNDNQAFVAKLIYYRLLQIDLDGRSQTSKVLTFYKHEKNNQLTFYPNPATATISIKGFNHLSDLQMFDASGKLIRSMHTVTAQIDVKGFARGTLVMVWKNEAGQTETTKILLE